MAWQQGKKCKSEVSQVLCTVGPLQAQSRSEMSPAPFFYF